jgi:hypothetical protein
MSKVNKHGTAAEHDPKDVEDARTADQLRAEIDAGNARDKVPASDPAAAPLGSDAEAGGRTTPREDIEKARQEEIRRRQENDEAGGED